MEIKLPDQCVKQTESKKKKKETKRRQLCRPGARWLNTFSISIGVLTVNFEVVLPDCYVVAHWNLLLKEYMSFLDIYPGTFMPNLSFEFPLSG